MSVRWSTAYEASEEALMRIAVIAPPWLQVPPNGYGGIEHALHYLCRALLAQGHDVLLYTTGDSTCAVERAWTYDTARGTDHVSPATELRHVIDAYDIVRRWEPDIVHDHTMAGPFYAERFPEITLITTNHGPFDSDLAPVYRRLASRVPIIAISHHQATTARDIPIAGVIHHGIDVDAFPVGAGDGGHALFLGRMSPDKGVHNAIAAARAAGMPLRIAAKMREQAEFEYFNQRIKPQLGSDIEYLGEVAGDAKLTLLAEAACLLNPIAWPEPFGMVMIEALACGTPVVATPTGAAPELIDDGTTGFLRSDIDSLKTALGHVNGLSRDACRNAATTRFSAKRMANEHIAIYQCLIDAAHTRRRISDTGRALDGIASDDLASSRSAR
jgi:glycosyltransferase involved in cell wall biosynthesis